MEPDEVLDGPEGIKIYVHHLASGKHRLTLIAPPGMPVEKIRSYSSELSIPLIEHGCEAFTEEEES